MQLTTAQLVQLIGIGIQVKEKKLSTSDGIKQGVAVLSAASASVLDLGDIAVAALPLLGVAL
jgi:hypothetical protein